MAGLAAAAAATAARKQKRVSSPLSLVCIVAQWAQFSLGRASASAAAESAHSRDCAKQINKRQRVRTISFHLSLRELHSAPAKKRTRDNTTTRKSGDSRAPKAINNNNNNNDNDDSKLFMANCKSSTLSAARSAAHGQRRLRLHLSLARVASARELGKYARTHFGP